MQRVKINKVQQMKIDGLTLFSILFAKIIILCHGNFEMSYFCMCVLTLVWRML